MNELLNKYGYCLNAHYSHTFEGSAGFAIIQDVMKEFRRNVKECKKGEDFVGKNIHTVLDYSFDMDGLPKSDVLKCLMEGNRSVIVRSIATRPKLKIYISVSAKTRLDTEKIDIQIVVQLIGFFQ